MGETIKGMVAAQGKLYVRGEQGLYTFKDNGKEPNEWDQAHFSAAPADRPFADFFFDEIHDLVNGSTIVNEDRQELRDAIMVMVTEGFLPACEDLRAIRAYKDDPRIPVLNRKKHYDDFARALWNGYKDLMPKIAALLGYDIGFLFQRDGKFKMGLEAFIAENRDHLLLDLAEFLPRQRNGWQQELKTLRNEYLEHRDAAVAAQVEKFYEPAWAEKVFVHRRRVTSAAATTTSAGMLKRGAPISVLSRTTRVFLFCRGCVSSIWPRISWAAWHRGSPTTGNRCMGIRFTSWRPSWIRSVFAGHVIRRLTGC
jgi:hypothetical protein